MDKFNYMGVMINKDAGMGDEVKCCRKTARSLLLECAKLLHKVLLILVYMYGNETLGLYRYTTLGVCWV